MSEEIQKLRDQILQAEMDDFNREAVAELMQEWSINVSENIPLMRMCKNLTEAKLYGKMATTQQEQSSSAIVIAASPDLTDEDIIKLRRYSGDIIVTNKNFKRLVDLGVTPDWVCLLDAHPISNMQFSWLNEPPYTEREPFFKDRPPMTVQVEVISKNEELQMVKFFVSSVVYPQTLRSIMEFSDNVYGFNPVDDSSKGVVRLSKTWEWMNDKMEFDHGGSVGGLAVNLASTLYYKKVGLMGFGLYDKPNPQWTLEQAKERDYIYYPDIDTVCAMPRHFKAYLAHILWTAKNSNWVEWYNLSNSPVLTHSSMLKQASVDDFIKEASE